jgi:hypothetical protein
MRLRDVLAELQSSLRALITGANATADAWRDPIQERFYREFIQPTEARCRVYIDSLASLDEALERIERAVRDIEARD